MTEPDKPVPGSWDWLQERIRPLDTDVEAALNEPDLEPDDTPIEIFENMFDF